jgi:hypothetical protein
MCGFKNLPNVKASSKPGQDAEVHVIVVENSGLKYVLLHVWQLTVEAFRRGSAKPGGNLLWMGLR